MILGVCSWLAAHFNIDATLVRIIFIIATIAGFGSPVLIYIVLYFIKEYKNKRGNG